MEIIESKNYIELFEVFRIALINGILDKSEIVKWADKIICQDKEPNYFIIELSLCESKSINDIISNINEFVGQDKPQICGRVILGFLYNQYIAGKITLKKVVGTIDWIIVHTDITDEEKLPMHGLDDKIDLAGKSIFRTIEAVEKETLLVIEKYKDFCMDNFNDWHRINETINDKIRDNLKTDN